MDDISWIGSMVVCDICNYEWIAARPAHLLQIECPHCHLMVNFTEKDVNTNIKEEVE